jgi:hypothetical protein
VFFFFVLYILQSENKQDGAGTNKCFFLEMKFNLKKFSVTCPYRVPRTTNLAIGFFPYPFKFSKYKQKNEKPTIRHKKMTYSPTSTCTHNHNAIRFHLENVIILCALE